MSLPKDDAFGPVDMQLRLAPKSANPTPDPQTLLLVFELWQFMHRYIETVPLEAAADRVASPFPKHTIRTTATANANTRVGLDILPKTKGIHRIPRFLFYLHHRAGRKAQNIPAVPGIPNPNRRYPK